METSPCSLHVILCNLGGGKFSACLGVEGHAEVQAEAPELGWIERNTDDSSTTTAALIFALLSAGLPVGVSERQKVTVDHYGLDIVVLLRGVPALGEVDFLHQSTFEKK